MRIFSALLVTAAVAAASPSVLVAKAVGRALQVRQDSGNSSTEGGDFNINLIPASCDSQCTTYKQIFGTCPENPSDAICAQACNQTFANDFNTCMGCVVNQGPAAGMAQHDIDILNIAQQQLVQECIEQGTPAKFSGTVKVPLSVVYPSGVASATYAPTGSQATAKPSSPASSSQSGSGSSPAASETAQGSGASSLQPLSVMGALFAAVAVAVVL